MKTLITAALLVIAGTLHAGCWTTPPTLTPVTFAASQAGAPIEGTFSRYAGRLCLPEDGNEGLASVEIETASIDMGLPEFNAEMRGPLFFDSDRWPLARFEAERLEALGNDRYRVSGTLTIRDLSRPLTAELTLREAGGRLEATGDIPLQRLDFDLGTGEWADTRWVGNDVTVQLDTELVPETP